jgi:hypothetical protein
VIALPIYTGVAEMAIKALDADWAAHNADAASFAALQIAAVYWCASLAVAGMPAVNQETFGRNDYAYRADVLTPSQLLAILRARASAIASMVASGSSADVMPFFFGVAAGTRARGIGDLPPVIPDGTVILGLP